MKNGARQMVSNCRALFVVFGALMLSATIAWSDSNLDFRVAAIIFAGENSRVLVEHTDGKQTWYRVGDSLDGSTILEIDDDAITVASADGQYRLSLRGDRNRIVASASDGAAPSRHQSREVGFLGLVSRINAVDRQAEETYEQAVSRNLNQVLGFGVSAKITAIGNVEVPTAAAARQELQRQLTHDEPIRITVENDFLEDLYVVPEYAD